MENDIVIVGAGIVGLSTAYNLKKKNTDLNVLVLEKESSIALHQTGNNSGVIHSGVYYVPGSLKAQNCFEGYSKLLDFCKEEDIPFDLCGKIIVATNDSEIPGLEKIYDRGNKNGLSDLEYLSPEQIKEIEPHCNGVKAIHVPQAGIINYKKVAQKILEKFQALGGQIKFNERVSDIDQRPDSIEIKTKNNTYTSKLLVNCAGLFSDKMAKMTGEEIDYQIVPFRGEYYVLKPEKSHLVKGLIYPVPDPNFPFLGVHFTKMIEGGVEAGPNAVLAFAREGYKKSNIKISELLESITYPGFIKLATKYWKEGAYEMYRSYSKKAFVKAMQTLIPEITSKDVVRGGAGVRAQALKKDGTMVDDFLILQKNNVINVCNAPSPAATSSLSIGNYISNKILNTIK